MRTALLAAFAASSVCTACVGAEPADRGCAFVVTCPGDDGATTELLDAECQVLGTADDGSFEYECTCLSNDGADQSPADDEFRFEPAE